MDSIVNEPFNREKQYANKRKAVIKAAGEAFRRRGYHNTSMVEIAKTLGLTKAALYYYVKSKEEILYECHVIVYDQMSHILRDNFGEGADGLEELTTIFSELVKMLTRDGVSLLTDVSSLSGDWQKDVLTRRSVIEARITATVRRGIDDGSIQSSDPKLAVYFFMGALNWLNAWYAPDGRVDGETVAAHFTQQMRSGLTG